MLHRTFKLNRHLNIKPRPLWPFEAYLLYVPVLVQLRDVARVVVLVVGRGPVRHLGLDAARVDLRAAHGPHGDVRHLLAARGPRVRERLLGVRVG